MLMLTLNVGEESRICSNDGFLESGNVNVNKNGNWSWSGLESAKKKGSVENVFCKCKS